MTHEVADFDRGAGSYARDEGDRLIDGVDPRDVLRSVWQGRGTVLGCALALGLLTFLFVSQLTPVYGSMAKVLLDPREGTPVAGDQVVADLDLSSEVVASEISILRSNVLLEDVIDAIAAEQPDLLEVLLPSTPKPSVLDRLATAVGLAEEEVAAIAVAPEGARRDALVWALRKATEVWREGDAYIISVYAETPDPVLSAVLAGTLVDRYIAQQVEGRQRTAGEATARIEARIADLRAQVEAAEAAVEDYRARSIETNGSGIDILSQRVLNLNEELVNARIESVAAETRFLEMQRLLNEGGPIALTNMVTSDSIVELGARRLQLEANDAEWAGRGYPPDHPERRKILGRIAEVDRSLDVEVARALDAQRNEAQIAAVREQTMEAALREVEARYLEASRDTIGLRQLERETEAVREVYKELLTRVAETRTQESFQVADARIIERAIVPGAPAAPRPKLLTAMAIAVGAALGLAIVLLRRLTSRTFRDIAELERATGLPVVAVLPEMSWTSTQAALDEIACSPTGPAAEAARALRGHINAGAPDAMSRSVALLSPLSGDGKTTATLMLARLAGLADEHVIVVDLDLRQDTVARDLGLPAGPGTAQVLRGEALLDRAIHRDPDLDFDVLPAGRAGPGDGPRVGALTSLLERLKEEYDTVFVNAPALLQAPEGAAIARSVDQCVLLVRYDATERSALGRCLSMLEAQHAPLEGVVLTRADLSAMPDGYLYKYGHA
jgi:uncharacterized protein involved in exopolysaccharide biosynthesis/Mrp family chromosome partitioning ATPase